MIVAVLAANAQPSKTISSFEQNKTRYTREHFVSGEDASSGFDYLFYKNGASIIKILSIWSATHTKEVRVDDLYFDGEAPVLLQRMTGTTGQLKALIKGRNMPLTPGDELYFTASKLVSWTEDRKPMARIDPKWDETEKFTLEHAKSMLESYEWLKEDK